MVFKSRRKLTNWRDFLTEQEFAWIVSADATIDRCKKQIAELSGKRSKIQNRATQRRRYRGAHP